jgi:hypothetical protein
MCIKAKTHTLQYKSTYTQYIHKLNILKINGQTLKPLTVILSKTTYFSVTGGSSKEAPHVFFSSHILFSKITLW